MSGIQGGCDRPVHNSWSFCEAWGCLTASQRPDTTRWCSAWAPEPRSCSSCPQLQADRRRRMTAVLGGLGAAVIWSLGNMFASQAARILGPPRTLAWVMLVGLVLVAGLLLFSPPPHITGKAALWLTLGGVGNVAGLLLMYTALRGGRLGVVMPIVAAEGGIAALIAVLAGQAVGAVRGLALIVTVLGVVMTAVTRPGSEARSVEPSRRALGEWVRHPEATLPTGRGDRRAALWAMLTAFSFGVSLYATGRAGAILPAPWAVLPPRLIGVAVITMPLALRRRLRVP